MEQVDIEAVIGRLDITAIAEDVLNDIDLPDIIRESSGTMASEGVQELRVQGMNAIGSLPGCLTVCCAGTVTGA